MQSAKSNLNLSRYPVLPKSTENKLEQQTRAQEKAIEQTEDTNNIAADSQKHTKTIVHWFQTTINHCVFVSKSLQLALNNLFKKANTIVIKTTIMMMIIVEMLANPCRMHNQTKPKVLINRKPSNIAQTPYPTIQGPSKTP